MPIKRFTSTFSLLKPFILSLFLIIVVSSQVLAQWPQLSEKDLSIQKTLIDTMQSQPKNALARFELAMHLAYTGWVEHGWYQLKQIPKLDPHFKESHEKVLFAQVVAFPEDAFLSFKMAFAYYFNDKQDLSLASFLKAHRLAPKNAWTMGFIAYIYSEKKQYQEAIQWCKKALEEEPKATALHFLLLEGYRKTGNYVQMMGESVHLFTSKSGEKDYAPPLPK